MHTLRCKSRAIGDARSTCSHVGNITGGWRAELGAVWTGSAQNAPPVAMDASVTFAPVGSLIPLALRHLRPGGTLAINAIYMTPLPEMRTHDLPGTHTTQRERFTSQDAVEFLKIAADVPVRTEVELFSLSTRTGSSRN